MARSSTREATRGDYSVHPSSCIFVEVRHRKQGVSQDLREASRRLQAAREVAFSHVSSCYSRILKYDMTYIEDPKVTRKFDDLILRVKECVLSAIEQRIRTYEEELTKVHINWQLPGYNFCNYFAIKESIAEIYECLELNEFALQHIQQILEYHVRFGSPYLLDNAHSIVQNNSKVCFAKFGGHEVCAARASSPSSGATILKVPLTSAAKIFGDLSTRAPFRSSIFEITSSGGSAMSTPPSPRLIVSPPISSVLTRALTPADPLAYAPARRSLSPSACFCARIF